MSREWLREAACRGLDPAEADRIFFPPEGSSKTNKHADYTEALTFCNRCPVREECLDAAMDAERGVSLCSRYGMSGGLTPVERWARSRDAAPREKACGWCGASFVPYRERVKTCSQTCSWKLRNASNAHKNANRLYEQERRERQSGAA